MKAANHRQRTACTRGAVMIALLTAIAATGGVARADGASEAKAATAASLRRALRTATVLLAARAAQAMNSATPTGKLPMTVFVGPVVAGADASGEGVVSYVAQASVLHGLIADFANAAILGEGGGTVFAVHAGSRRRGRGSSAAPTEEAEREMARKAGADYLIEATLQATDGDSRVGKESGAGGSGGGEVHLALQLVDAREGTVVCVSDTALPDVSTAAKDSAVDRKKG